MTKILLTEVHSIANVGSAAVLENVIAHLSEAISDAEITLSATDPETIAAFSKRRTLPELFVRPAKLGTPLKRLRWLVPNLVWVVFNSLSLLLKWIGLPYMYKWFTLSEIRRAVISEYIQSDVIISVGAERINDNFRPQLPFALYGYWFAKRLGKPVVLYAQTIGPFRHRLSKWMVRRVLRQCDLVTVRDGGSLRVCNSLGISGARVIEVADPAILQPALSKAEANSILRDEGVDLQPPVIGISALRWTYVNARDGRTPEEHYENYINSLARLADHLVEGTGAHVLFVATNFAVHGNRDDDVSVALQIKERMNHKSAVDVLGKLFRPAELKGIIGLCDMFIASRMHACIFATAMCVPTMALNYQFKLFEYMRLLGLEDYSCDFDRISLDKLRSIADTVWDRRQELRQHLQERMKELKRASFRSAVLVAELLRTQRGASPKTWELDDRDQCANEEVSVLYRSEYS